MAPSLFYQFFSTCLRLRHLPADGMLILGHVTYQEEPESGSSESRAGGFLFPHAYPPAAYKVYIITLIIYIAFPPFIQIAHSMTFFFSSRKRTE